VRELAIDQTFTPIRKSDKYIITDPKLTKIRDEIAAEMRSLPCYHRSPFLCEYLINALAIIARCYRDGHQFSPLLAIADQYDDAFFKSQLEGLINGKMVDIARVANEKRKRCEEYTAIDMSVHSLAVWHSYLGLHARWVLGVRHNKERGASKRRYCSQEGCGNQLVQGGVCQKHGASVKRRCCSQEGCSKQAQQGGVCVKHGARGKRCSQKGYSKQVVQGGVCAEHGARKRGRSL